MKQARNLSQIFNRKSISRNTTYRQSLNPIQIEKGGDQSCFVVKKIFLAKYLPDHRFEILLLNRSFS